MKNHIAILIGALALCSCEDYLTQENPNKIESEYYFTDESSLEIYTNGFIRSFATAIKSFVDGDKNADTHSWDGQAAYFMDNYSADDATNWTTSNWSQLRSINYYLDNMRNAVASDAILDHYEGVGRFFRALFYIDKVQTFGAVPWYDTSIDATDREALFKDRDNREFVASKILEDLDYACTYCLTSDKYRVRASYIHRYVALALKARFCLYEGTMRKYHAVDPSTGRAWTKDESRFYLGECVKACEAIMGDGVYKLTDDPAKRQTQYRDMFTNADACGVYTDEFIWARDYDIDLKVTYAINNYMVNPQHANYAFTRQFIDTYLMTDGTPFTSKYPDYDDLDLVAECTDRDYRLAQTIRTPGFTRDGGTTQWAPDVKFSKTGYQPIKWLTDDSFEGYQCGCHRFGRAADTLRRSAARLCRGEGRTGRDVGGGLGQDDQTAARTRGSEEHLSHGGRPLHGRIFPESGDRSFHSGGAPRTGYRADDGEQPLPGHYPLASGRVVRAAVERRLDLGRRYAARSQRRRHARNDRHGQSQVAVDAQYPDDRRRLRGGAQTVAGYVGQYPALDGARTQMAGLQIREADSDDGPSGESQPHAESQMVITL